MLFDNAAAAAAAAAAAFVKPNNGNKLFAACDDVPVGVPVVVVVGVDDEFKCEPDMEPE